MQSDDRTPVHLLNVSGIPMITVFYLICLSLRTDLLKSFLQKMQGKSAKLSVNGASPTISGCSWVWKHFLWKHFFTGTIGGWFRLLLKEDYKCVIRRWFQIFNGVLWISLLYKKVSFLSTVNKKYFAWIKMNVC